MPMSAHQPGEITIKSNSGYVPRRRSRWRNRASMASKKKSAYVKIGIGICRDKRMSPEAHGESSSAAALGIRNNGGRAVIEMAW